MVAIDARIAESTVSKNAQILQRSLPWRKLIAMELQSTISKRTDVHSSAQNLLPDRRSTRFDLVIGAEMYVCVAQVLPRNGCSVKKTCMGCVVCREKMHECRLDGPHLRRTRGRDPPQTVSPLTHPLTPRLASRALMRVASLACAGPAKRGRFPFPSPTLLETERDMGRTHMGPPPPGLWHRAVVVTTRVPPKVRLDGEAKLAASLFWHSRSG